MPIQPNKQRQPGDLYDHDTRHPKSPEHSSWRRMGSLLLLVAILALIAACAPDRQTQTPPSVQTQAAHQRAFTYVAIGASDSFGIGTDDPARQSWPVVLAGLIGPDTHLVNLGIPGETVAEARATELPVALDADPQVVTVWLGVNDIVQSVPVDVFATNLEAMLRALDEHTHAHVFVANIPDLTALPYFATFDQQALQQKIARWNAAIDKVVGATRAILVDLDTSWSAVAQHPEYIASDGLHPSTEGAKQLAAVFLSWIMIVMPDIHAEAGAS